METITITTFRANIFSFLKKVVEGAPLALVWKGKTIAKIIPEPAQDWRHHLTSKGRINTTKAFQPIKNIWRDFEKS